MSENVPAIRDELINRVSYGQMTPDEAEAEAKRLGLEPFARVPDPEDFNPMAEANWTLPMAVSWIAYRTAEAVREAWPAYRENCWHWNWRRWRNGPDGEVHEGWFLEQRRFPSLPLVELAEIVDRAEGNSAAASQLMTMREARESLWIALGEGMLSATAVPRVGGARVTIPSEEWSGLSPKDSDHRDELSGNGFNLAYVDMLVPSKAVTLLWGPRRESRASLPPLVRPDGFGYMPLSCAAQWIATEGGARDFDPADETIWRDAFDKLLGAIASEMVRVVGMRAGGREPVPGFHFASIVVDYPFAEASIDLMMSETVYLQCYPFTDDEQWRRRFHDSLVTRHKDHWTHLVVEKGDVRALWPFGSSEPVRSGAPGRPTSMHLVFAELERRANAGTLSDSIVRESKDLSRWLASNHGNKPQARPKSIEAAIRARYYELRARK